MTAQRIETEATILNVTDDANWKYSIEADIPAFDGDKPYLYMAWNKKQGPPPQVGATVLGTFEAYARAKYYVKRGDLEDAPVDGSEKHFQITWNFTAARPIEATNGAEVAPTTGATPPASMREAWGATAAPTATYLAAPTADERTAKEIAGFRRREEGVNDRKAVSDVLALVELGTYTLDGLLQDATRLANWYNARLTARCGSPLVQAAQDAGAVLTNVSPTESRINLFDENSDEQCTLPPPPSTAVGVGAIKNRPDLDGYVKGKGWAKADISRVLQDAGFASSAQYLEDSSNSVQGLASLLTEALDSW